MKIKIHRSEIDKVIWNQNLSEPYIFEISEDQIVKEDKPKAKMYKVSGVQGVTTEGFHAVCNGDIIKLEEVE